MPFNIRTDVSSPADGDFILAAFDAALPHLASVGSGDQWGSIPWSTVPERCNTIHGSVDASIAYDKTGTGDPVRTFIAEAEVPAILQLEQGLPTRTDGEGSQWVSVAAAVVQEEYFADYVEKQPQFAALVGEEREKGSSMYLRAMISDFRVPGELRKGSGGAVLGAVREYALARKSRVVYVDCWAGNGEKLVRRSYLVQCPNIPLCSEQVPWNRDDMGKTLTMFKFQHGGFPDNLRTHH